MHGKNIRITLNLSVRTETLANRKKCLLFTIYEWLNQHLYILKWKYFDAFCTVCTRSFQRSLQDTSGALVVFKEIAMYTLKNYTMLNHAIGPRRSIAERFFWLCFQFNFGSTSTNHISSPMITDISVCFPKSEFNFISKPYDLMCTCLRRTCEALQYSRCRVLRCLLNMNQGVFFSLSSLKELPSTHNERQHCYYQWYWTPGLRGSTLIIKRVSYRMFATHLLQTIVFKSV